MRFWNFNLNLLHLKIFLKITHHVYQINAIEQRVFLTIAAAPVKFAC
jgi:hypothetical protein